MNILFLIATLICTPPLLALEVDGPPSRDGQFDQKSTRAEAMLAQSVAGIMAEEAATPLQPTVKRDEITGSMLATPHPYFQKKLEDQRADAEATAKALNYKTIWQKTISCALNAWLLACHPRTTSVVAITKKYPVRTESDSHSQPKASTSIELFRPSLDTQVAWVPQSVPDTTNAIAVAFDQTGDALIFANTSNQLQLQSVASGICLSKVALRSGISCVASSHNRTDPHIAVGTHDGQICIFQVDTHQQLKVIKSFQVVPRDYSPSIGSAEQLKRVEHIQFTQNGKNLVAAGARSISCYDENFNCVGFVQTKAPIIHLSINPESTTVATVAGEHLRSWQSSSIELWTIPNLTRTEILLNSFHPKSEISVGAITLGPKNLLAAATEGGGIIFFNIDKRIRLQSLGGGLPVFQQLNFLPDGTLAGLQYNQITFFRHQQKPQIDLIHMLPSTTLSEVDEVTRDDLFAQVGAPRNQDTGASKAETASPSSTPLRRRSSRRPTEVFSGELESLIDTQPKAQKQNWGASLWSTFSRRK